MDCTPDTNTSSEAITFVSSLSTENNVSFSNALSIIRTKSITDERYKLHSINGHCILYGVMNNFEFSFFAAEYIDGEQNKFYGKHGDRLGNTLILYCTYIEEVLAFVCLEINPDTSINIGGTYHLILYY